MELTTAAQWLNTSFYSFDYAILGFYHSLAESAGAVLTPFLSALTLTAWKGAFLIVLSFVLIAFRKTRRTGICTLLAIAIGALFTNLFIKDMVARPRPYLDPLLREWWVSVGSHTESDLSFPSGHMTAATAFTTAFVLVRGKRWLPYGILYVILMGVSRNYLIVHYPTDVLGGFLIGVLGGCVSFLLVRLIYRRFGQSKALRET